MSTSPTSPTSRRNHSRAVRNEAAEVAAHRPHPRHRNNGEEFQYRDASQPGVPITHVANYTKGLPHDEGTGIVLNPVDYKLFVTGIQSGDPLDFVRTPLGPGVAAMVPDAPSNELIKTSTTDRSKIWQSKAAQTLKPSPAEKGARVRAWESAGAGNVLDLEGPDAQAVTMPPAPRFDSDELVAETAEVYAMALLRDLPFRSFPLPVGSTHRAKDQTTCAACADPKEFDYATKLLTKLPWFESGTAKLPPEESRRHRSLQSDGSNLFRGTTPGEDIGPYLSQFLLLGNQSIEQNGTAKPARNPTDGYVGYGALGIQQRVRVATECKDYLTAWEPWIDVQNGADLRGQETYRRSSGSDDGHRFITTGRDLATYVHYDALYEAYLNACLFLLASGAPFDRGIPFLEADTFDKQQGFAHFGGPHILTLVTEVATRALKAVRYQKFNVHRRLRPEAVGGRLDRWFNQPTLQTGALQPLEQLARAFAAMPWGPGKTRLKTAVRDHNRTNNGKHFSAEGSAKADSFLLPMAFPEGSPMHPSYGAGHATVAGACVTVLKAYFDHGWTPPELLDGTQAVAYEASNDGSQLLRLRLDRPLTVEGELNKLAANIAIGRNWAGVHYYSDYIESMRMGEEIAIGLLEEQKLTFPENFSMTVPLFDGGAIQI